MTECCSVSNAPLTYPKKHACPINGQQYASVSIVTILHHIGEPWLWKSKPQGYYFCSDPKCDVVYYGQDNTLIFKPELKTTIGIKTQSADALLCYCFSISKKLASNQSIKDFVIKNTKDKICTCATSNPSGKCCLKDFPH